MAQASFSLDLEITCSCVKCGIERDLPENDQAMPSPEDDGVTVFADSPCGCGARRVRVGADLAD